MSTPYAAAQLLCPADRISTVGRTLYHYTNWYSMQSGNHHTTREVSEIFPQAFNDERDSLVHKAGGQLATTAKICGIKAQQFNHIANRWLEKIEGSSGDVTVPTSNEDIRAAWPDENPSFDASVVPPGQVVVFNLLNVWSDNWVVKDN